MISAVSLTLVVGLVAFLAIAAAVVLPTLLLLRFVRRVSAPAAADAWTDGRVVTRDMTTSSRLVTRSST